MQRLRAECRVPKLPCLASFTELTQRNLSRACGLDTRLGQLRLFGMQPPWDPFVPLFDGRPALKGCELLEAEYQRNILAVKVRHPNNKPELTVRLYRGPNGIPLAEYRVPLPASGFALSSDSRLLALQTIHGQVEVRDTTGDGTPIASTYAGNFSPRQLLLGHRWLLLRKGRANYFLLNWQGGSLEVRQRPARGQ